MVVLIPDLCLSIYFIIFYYKVTCFRIIQVVQFIYDVIDVGKYVLTSTS